MSEDKMSDGEGYMLVGMFSVGFACIIFGLVHHNWMLWATGVTFLGMFSYLVR